MSNKPKNYSLTARIIHWVSALSVIGLFGVGLWMVDLTYYSEWYKTAPYWHKSVGLILAVVTLFRLVWKHVSAQPSIEGKAFEVLAAKLAHIAMYLLLFTLFASGYLISTADGRGIEVFDWFVVPSMGELFANQPDIAGAIHYYAAFALIGLVVIHAAAALKHHFIDKDDTLRKMIGVSK
ncbi:cytochrome b561 [Vibrio nigripulchritudo ATCC 27043]|uniref:Cytochrome b561 n=2 Tax=Vibrio nigripulchritudo TaxID=28173 RepID=A0AAV2VSY6_9VIBR|nr:cytochrome b [Vibrio nigripulchritudo]EGU50871.1 cytochrome b561 [Vibrio nigripulchritudo ATCC 27043]CCN71355.1 putative cytochrome b561 [Vibrio nigripulchritudo SFn118]CCN81561.1 putative cytochrome b561 [Vibrio nigripulchritudo BLFn1]CCN91658.1 putative cytochrome b561 [Vibrio nigripulchritudo SFn27]CCN96542.1 putative cytochrome b561 [Vibrio nigripulchritudo ENn2]